MLTSDDDYEIILNEAQVKQFFTCVALSQPKQVDAFLKGILDEGIKTSFLTISGLFPGRKEECTAAEYAYWAWDDDLLSVLQAHSKTALITGTQRFDLTPLKNALQNYLDTQGRGVSDILEAQKNLPAYIQKEYAHPDRRFHPCPHFEKGDSLLDFKLSWFDLSAGPLFRAAQPNLKILHESTFQKLAIGRDLAAIQHLEAIRNAPCVSMSPTP
jgi:hypothetical protein